MAHIYQWFQRFARKGTQPAPPAPEAVDKALARDITRVSAQDPDTIGQWNLLRVRLANASQAAASTRMAQPLRWLKPAVAIGVASVVVAIALRFYWFSPAAPMIYETGGRQQSLVLLADSSEVILNHNSELRVDREGAVLGRRTALTGEAYFKVRKSKEPFIVKTEFGSVQVLGTEFNVRMRRGEMEVAVVTGRVRVTASREGKDSTVILQGGEFTAFARGACPRPPQRLPFVQDYPGWLHGKFLFDRTPLAAACREIADQFGISIELNDAALAGKTITGSIDGRSPDAAVQTLCLLSGVSFRNDQNGYILY